MKKILAGKISVVRLKMILLPPFERIGSDRHQINRQEKINFTSEFAGLHHLFIEIRVSEFHISAKSFHVPISNANWCRRVTFKKSIVILSHFYIQSIRNMQIDSAFNLSHENWQMRGHMPKKQQQPISIAFTHISDVFYSICCFGQ